MDIKFLSEFLPREIITKIESFIYKYDSSLFNFMIANNSPKITMYDLHLTNGNFIKVNHDELKNIILYYALNNKIKSVECLLKSFAVCIDCMLVVSFQIYCSLGENSAKEFLEPILKINPVNDFYRYVGYEKFTIDFIKFLFDNNLVDFTGDNLIKMSMRFRGDFAKLRIIGNPEFDPCARYGIVNNTPDSAKFFPLEIFEIFKYPRIISESFFTDIRYSITGLGEFSTLVYENYDKYLWIRGLIL